MTNDHRHGCAHERGVMDSYYRRPYAPHYYTGATYASDRIGEPDMTPEEVAAYAKGYNDNERDGDFKDWG